MTLREKLSLAVGIIIFSMVFFGILLDNVTLSIVGAISLLSLLILNVIKNIIDTLL